MTRPRRALLVVQNESVPYDRRVWKEACALRDAGWVVSVVSPQSGLEPEPFVVVDGIEIHRFRQRESAGGLRGYALEYGWALWSIARLMTRVRRRRGFDVVQLCNPPDVLFLAAWPWKLRGVRLVFDHHDLAPELWLARRKGASSFVHRILLWAERATFATADVVLSTNDSYQRIAIERGGVDPAQVFVVRNGPDPNELAPAAAGVASHHGWQHILGYIGSLGPQDGVAHLVSLVHLLVEDGRDVGAVLVGDGPELARLQRQAARLGVADRLQFVGRVPPAAVAGPIAAADVCICPDPRSPLNEVSTMIKTLEYMSLGKPVVAFDLHETRVSAGDGALYAKGDDDADLAAQVVRLLDDPALGRELGQRGRARIVKQLAWEHSVPSLLAAYTRALS